MKALIATLITTLLIAATPAFADAPPKFLAETMPEKEMGLILQGFGAIQAENELDRKTKELISLAVAAQIPCQYCVHAHTESLKKMGATQAEIKEAIAMAGYIRLMSTILNGNNYDYDAFVQEWDQMMAGS